MGLNTRYRTEYSIGLNAVGPDSEHSTEYTSYTYILNSLANNLSQVRIAQDTIPPGTQGYW